MWSWSHECNPHQWNKCEKKESNIGKFTRLIDLGCEIERKFDSIIESWFIAKITTKVFICCLPRLTRKISSSLRIFFCEFSIRIDSIPIWYECISSTWNKLCYMGKFAIFVRVYLRDIFDYPRREAEDKREAKHKWNNERILQSCKIFFWEECTRNENYCKREKNSSNYHSRIMKIREKIHVYNRPEFSDRKDSKEESSIDRDSKILCITEKNHCKCSNYEHQGCQLDCKSDSCKNTSETNENHWLWIQWWNILCYTCKDRMVIDIKMFLIWAIDAKTTHESYECSNRYTKKCWIYLHVFCKMKYNHWQTHHSCSNNKRPRGKSRYMSVSDRSHSKNTSNYKENATKLREKKCLSWTTKEKSKRGKMLPSNQSHSSTISRECNKARIVHINTKIIPPYWHRTEDWDDIRWKENHQCKGEQLPDKRWKYALISIESFFFKKKLEYVCILSATNKSKYERS